ncbi:hypothetical protein GCM10027055_17380 [Janibacter alkaliphilus]|uniref:DUF4307 domain-containing protein n=1 Tax=Janibacter alkaliphilus TaxID=1069963 RepID=A0A852WXR0_9MICO|nr:DUF4307 domain-containing protein [Janibacter alkaliphilus]NYG35812.1 hypothetical protein [Janibacter alkaliphilus]
MTSQPGSSAAEPPDQEPSDQEPWDAEAEEAALDRARPARRSTDRRWWIVGGVLLTAVVAVMVWFGLSATQGSVTAEVITYEPGERETSVTFEVTRPEGEAVSCTLEVVDGQHASVGRRDVTIPAGPSPTRTSAVVRTTTPGSNVDEPECRLTG